MIHLERKRTIPEVHPNFFGSKRVELNKMLIKQKLDGVFEKTSKIKNKWNSKIWKEAKDQLLRETHNKCAYCETPTRVVAYGDVEHFRPKSVYWWLAYCYENYLPSCTACNQEYKKDKFDLLNPAGKLAAPQVSLATIDADAPMLTPDPINNAEGYDIATFEQELLNEWALIVHPYLEDPTEYYAYEVILENQEVRIVPTSPEYEVVIKASHKIFGINRKELMDLRFQWYCLYMTFRHTLSVANLPTGLKTANQNRIAEMLEDWSPYAGMIRYFDSKPIQSLPWDFNIRITGDLRTGNNM